jgi:pilin isopeptide linkage protein
MNRIDRKRKRSIGERFLAFLLAFLLIVESSGTQFKAVSAADSVATPVNLANYLTDNSTMHITVTVDGKNYSYTPAELTEKGLLVPKGAPVKVELYFNTINDVQKGQKLVYQLPDNLMDYSGADKNGIVWEDIVYETNNSGAYVEAADWVIDNTGLLTVTLRDDFFDSNQINNKITLFGFNIKFSGSLSKNRGETSGNGDDVVSFKGETEGKLTFKIPFEYLNENADVEIEKTLASYDVTTRTASYQIKVTAPSANIYNATDVKVTDVIQGNGKDYIETVTKNKIIYTYQNYAASTGVDSFDAAKGIWTIGDMIPGQTETLTYDLVISDDAYKANTIDEIKNVATVEFNDDGTNTDDVTIDLPTTLISKEAIKNASGNYMSTDSNGSYLTYKLTVTATDGAASNLIVKDTFSDATVVTSIVVDSKTTGTTTIDNSAATLTWNISSIAAGATETLTYKAYVDANKWRNSNYTKVTVNNTATLSVDNGETGTPTIIDTATTKNILDKTWVKKIGTLITDSGNAKYNKLKYTVKVNGDPVYDDIVSVYDTLKGSTYESGGNLVIDRYTSSDKKTLVDTTTIALSEIVSNTSTGQRWDVNLSALGLSGRYYYEFTYYVEALGVVEVNNDAGIGFGDGTGYYASTKIEGSGGMSYGNSAGYYKSKGIDGLSYSYNYPIGNNYKDGYSAWTVYVQQTIPQGAVYIDRLSEPYVWRYEQFWFDDKTLNGIVIKFGDEVLTEGEDYTVKGVRELSGYDNDAAKTDPTGSRYNRFEITFNKEFAATASKKVTIAYMVNISNTAHDEDFLRSDGWFYDGGQAPQFYNYCLWQLPSNGTTITTNQIGENGGWTVIRPLLKDNATFNTSSGEVSWNLTVNKDTTVNGDATLIEYLPAGFTFESATITERGNTIVASGTSLGTITQETYIDSDGNEAVKVIIPIKDLAGYIGVSSGNPVEYYETTDFGMIKIKITTKVDTEWYMNLANDVELTNTAVLTDNDSLPAGGVTATGTVKVPSGQLVSKSKAGVGNPAYVEYALNINSNAMNIIADSDVLQVVDVMGDGMSLATEHADSFKVYDITNVNGAVDSSGNIVVSTVEASGIDVTDSCTIDNITGQTLDGLEAYVGKPTYMINVPDGKHLAVIYWASYEGSAGVNTTVTNKASFFYNGKVQLGGGSSTSDTVAAADASSDLFVGAFFYVNKTDQKGKKVSGVTYKLYEITTDSSGNVTAEKEIMSQTTDSFGSAYFGHMTSDQNPQLYKDKLYCLKEVIAPAGYKIDTNPYYFEFKTSNHGIVDHPSNVTVHQFVSGGTYSFTNQFTPASLTIPVEKLINSKSVSSTTEFSFTLKQTSGEAVYTDESYSKALTTAGISASVKGTGKTTFDTLYFTKEGTYTFTLSENDLSRAATAQGYTKDSKTYTLTVVVGHTTDSLTISSATYASSEAAGTSVDLTTTAPIFNNGSHMSGTITLHAKKVVENRTADVKADEFGFTVSVGGEVVPETNDDGSVKYGSDGKPVKKVFYTKAGGDIDFEIPIDQDDVGTQTYIISEVTGTDSSIKYTTDKVRVKVTIAETGNGKVEATNYEYLTDAVFTNEYVASGSLTITGTKVLKSSSTNEDVSQKKDEFHFVVKEGSATVATGSNNADGSITFTTINYSAEDIGTTHTYYISEVNEHEQYIEYSTDTARLQVKVTDGGNGKLNLSTMYVNSKTDDNGGVLFINSSTFTIPTGISIDVKPYLVVLAIVAVAGVTLITVRRKSKKHNG